MKEKSTPSDHHDLQYVFTINENNSYKKILDDIFKSSNAFWKLVGKFLTQTYLFKVSMYMLPKKEKNTNQYIINYLFWDVIEKSKNQYVLYVLCYRSLWAWLTHLTWGQIENWCVFLRHRCKDEFVTVLLSNLSIRTYQYSHFLISFCTENGNLKIFPLNLQKGDNHIHSSNSFKASI